MLVETVNALKSIDAAQVHEIAQLTTLVAESSSRNESLAAQVQTLDADIDQLDRTYAESRLEALNLRSQLNQIQGAPNSGKPNLVVVVTTISQIVQLKAFVTAAPIKEIYDFTIVAYFELKVTSLPEFCAENGISLLDHNGDVLMEVTMSRSLLGRKADRPYLGRSFVERVRC